MAELKRACSNCGNLIEPSSSCPYCARKKKQATNVGVPLSGSLHKAARHGFVLSLDIPIEVAHEISMAAILKDNYLIDLDQPNLIRCRENRPFTATSLTTAITLDVHLQAYGSTTCKVAIDVGHGFSGLFDAVVATHRSHMRRLKNMIEAGYREHVRMAPAEATDIASQISRLSELFDAGNLTLEEFTLAKKRILNP